MNVFIEYHFGVLRRIGVVFATCGICISSNAEDTSVPFVGVGDRSPEIEFITHFPLRKFDPISVSYTVSFYRNEGSRPQEALIFTTRLKSDKLSNEIRNWLVEVGYRPDEASKILKGELVLFDGDIQNKELDELKMQVGIRLDSARSIVEGVKVSAVTITAIRPKSVAGGSGEQKVPTDKPMSLPNATSPADSE